METSKLEKLLEIHTKIKELGDEIQVLGKESNSLSDEIAKELITEKYPYEGKFSILISNKKYLVTYLLEEENDFYFEEIKEV